MLWSEPSGSGGTDISSDDDMPKKAKVYNKTRRFVIVDDSKKGHSICLPIFTYGGQATLKRGVHSKHHAQIYTSIEGATMPPPLLPGEHISKKAIRVETISPAHRLDPLSRINYAKLYTVEHNLKVYFIGWVAKHYEQQVVTDYNETHPPLPSRPWASSGLEENHSFNAVEELELSYQLEYDGPQHDDPEASPATGSSSIPWRPNQSSRDPPSVEDPEYNTQDVMDDIQDGENIYDVDC